MTDNEVIFAFVNGCELLKSDDVSLEDMHSIRLALDNCAKNLIPYVHKYVTQRDCHQCKHNKSKHRDYTECKHIELCYGTVDRKYFDN